MLQCTQQCSGCIWALTRVLRRLEYVGVRLDLTVHSHRYKFLLSIGHLYYLLITMSNKVTRRRPRRDLYSRNTSGDRTITYDWDSVEKVINEFREFCKKGTSLKLIISAYEVAEDLAKERQGVPPVLVKARGTPQVSTKTFTQSRQHH